MRSSIETNQLHLSQRRIELADLASNVLATHRTLLEAVVRALEQTLHGSVARGVRAKADYLACITEGMEKKLEIQYQQALAQLYTPDVQLALKNHERHLKQEIRGLRERLEEAETQLHDYERVKGMRVIAAAYGEVKRECETVQEEIRRLEDSR
ncbi:putative alpha-1,6-mannosyltransferase mnn11 [Elasticomyces elasticus]|nr:putative alpha-1,6-mannosyltransferase mnn11 [Elasticomyces elasticus]